MILADKIINERKKNGWSQEEFADMLGVSRQAVSKWEGAQSTPDLQRIVQMAELFGVSTDYLLKDEIEAPAVMEINGSELMADGPRKIVTLEEAGTFLYEKEKSSGIVARGVALCIISPALLIMLSGFISEEGGKLPEAMAIGIGLVTLLLLVAIAVYSFIVTGSRLKEYEYLEKEVFETAYGVTGMVKEKAKEFAPVASSRVAIGVILCILCSVPLIVSAIIEAPEYIICSMVAVLLIIVSAGVFILVKTNIVKSSYAMLLQEDEYTVKEKELNKKFEPVSGVYWCIVTAAYLAVSFITNRWDVTWIIWPVSAVFFGAVMSVLRIVSKDR